jgi:hypothetical protein
LEKTTNNAGIAYSLIAPKFGGEVPADQYEKLTEYLKAIKPIIGYMVNTQVQRDEA